MKISTTAIAMLLTTLLLCGCAAGPSRQAAAKTRTTADAHCESARVGAHCITGEELERFGARDTAEALRMAFPWIN